MAAVPVRPSSPPIRVLDGEVDMWMWPLTGEPAGQGWRRIECASKKAYGCGKSMEAAVQGLTLYVRLGDGPLVTSSLAIRMSDEAARWFSSEEEELDEPAGSRRKEELPEIYPVSRILKFEQDLIVIGLSFEGDRPEDLLYVLLYDGIDASLSLISYLPGPYNATAALQAVPNRTVGGGGACCELLLTVREMTCEQPPAVLYVFSPAANSSSACPWQMNRMRFPPPGLILEPFMATKAFSFQGKGFWADLTQGLVCCDLQQATTSSDDRNSAVDFGFVGLPPGVRELDVAGTLRMRHEPANLTRNLGCIGNTSIWFICVDRAADYKDDDSVTMSTLQSPPHGRWKEEWKFTTTELWGFDGFKEAGLPEAPPEFPVLTADGHLCLVLTDRRRPREGRVVVGHICGIDVPNKRVLWHGKVRINYPFTDSVIIPSTSSFFHRTVSCHGQ